MASLRVQSYIIVPSLTRDVAAVTAIVCYVSAIALYSKYRGLKLRV